MSTTDCADVHMWALKKRTGCLLRALSCPNWQVICDAATALAAMDDPRIVLALIRTLDRFDSKRGKMSYEVYDSLVASIQKSLSGKGSPHDVECMMAQVTQCSALAQSCIFKAFGHIRDLRCIPTIIRFLEEKAFGVHEMVYGYRGHCRLSNIETGVKEAVIALGEMASPQAEDILIVLIEHFTSFIYPRQEFPQADGSTSRIVPTEASDLCGITARALASIGDVRGIRPLADTLCKYDLYFKSTFWAHEKLKEQYDIACAIEILAGPASKEAFEAKHTIAAIQKKEEDISNHVYG